MTSNTTAPRTLVSDESVIGCTLDEVSVVVLGDRLVVVPITREAALLSGFELGEVDDSELLALGVLPRASAQPIAPLAPTSAVSPSVIPIPQPNAAPVPATHAGMPQVLAPPVLAPQVASNPVANQVVSADAIPRPPERIAPASDAAGPTSSPGQTVLLSNRQAGLGAPAPAPDFSAWPYVDRRTLTADDDVPTAQNFLNASVAPERRGRNADAAAVQTAPFGDLPRSYDSSISDSRAKPEARTPNTQSTVQIGMASLPIAPLPTVVPSPVAGIGSYDPERANALPEPIVIPAPAAQAAVPSAAVSPTVPANAATYEPIAVAPEVHTELPFQKQESFVHVDDISESPLARLLAAQTVYHSAPASDAVGPIASPGPTVPPGYWPLVSSEELGVATSQTAQTPGGVQENVTAALHSTLQPSGQPTVQPSGGSPFAAPKVGRGAGLFDIGIQPAVLENGPTETPPPIASALWSGEAVLPELPPMSSTFGTQTPVTEPETLRGLPEPVPVVQVEPQSEKPLIDVPKAIMPMPFSIPELGQPKAVEAAAQASIEQMPSQTRLSPEALQQVYTFDDENPEDLIPLGVSDRLVLRWSANASEELRVSTVGLSIGWPSAKPLVSGLDIDLVSGDVLVVDGPERSGKTALLKTFAGHLAPLHGDVSLDGHSLGTSDGADFRRREALSLCYVGANSLLVSDLSLVENIELPLLAEGVSPHDARPAALAWLESAGLSGNAHLPAGSLSNSDARIAAVIRTLICGPALVCVDDVTSGMGISSARMVLALLEHAQSTGAVLLIATNDARLEFDGGYRANIEACELVPVG